MIDMNRDLLSKALQAEAIRQEQEEKTAKALDEFLSLVIAKKKATYKDVALKHGVEWTRVRDMHNRLLRELSKETEEDEE